MGLMDKVKSLFTEEVEIEEEQPVSAKRERIKDVELPKREEIKSEAIKETKIADTPVLTREERPKTPIYFDDTAFEDLKAAKQIKRAEVKKVPLKREITKKTIEDAYKGNLRKEETKVFKPSPIISPVYGVLDRNYHKDDIQPNDLEKPTVSVKKNNAVTIDDIRNKAFGTLENDLENTFITNELLNKKDYQLEKSIDTELDTGLDIFEGLNTREARNSKVDLLKDDYNISDDNDISKEIEKQKQKINEINEYIKSTKTL